MKLKCLPEDFRVEELTSVRAEKGPFSLYRLEKQSIGTPEAVSAVSTRWQIHRRRISYGGLKDKHAVTVQYLTIHQGPRKDLQQKSFTLNYIGQVSEPFTSAQIEGNRFTLVLRDMHADDTEYAQSAIKDVSRCGLPNYFDDQRFGSLGVSGEWIGKAWCLGDYQRALWLALADPHFHDASDEKQQKQILRDLWDLWPKCKQALGRSHRRSIVTYLADKVESGKTADYRGAFARISVDLRGLYLSAYQSALWNRLLTRAIAVRSAEFSVLPFELISGRCLFPRDLTPQQADELKQLELPLPSARIDRPEGPIGDLLDGVLAEEKMELRQLRVKYPRDSFFSRGQRAAMISPQNLTSSVQADERYNGRCRLTLSFDLPRGSYATILVKRLTEVSGGPLSAAAGNLT